MTPNTVCLSKSQENITIQSKRKFFVNDYVNYNDVEMLEDGSYNIVNTISINGNEEFIKDLQKRRRESYANNRTRGISGLTNNAERVGEFDGRDNVTIEREQTWIEYVDEILEKVKSGRSDRIGNSAESARNSKGNQYSLSDKASSEDGVFLKYDRAKMEYRSTVMSTIRFWKDCNLNEYDIIGKTLIPDAVTELFERNKFE